MFKQKLSKTFFASLLFVILVFFTSCHFGQFRNISEFNMQPNALKDGEKIRLLAYFYGPSNSGIDFYNHMVVQSEQSGDTCNILIPWEHGFEQSDGDSIYNYFSPDNLINQVNVEGLSAGTRNIRPEDFSAKFPDYNKVVRIKAFDHIAKNNFPTVKGSIGMSK